MKGGKIEVLYNVRVHTKQTHIQTLSEPNALHSSCTISTAKTHGADSGGTHAAVIHVDSMSTNDIILSGLSCRVHLQVPVCCLLYPARGGQDGPALRECTAHSLREDITS